MRYAADQKDETRRKLVREAASRMRLRGPDGVGVADIMRGVGLTHGGFYAHFESKDDLIAHAVAQMFADGAARYARDDALPAAERLARFIERYVSTAHRDRPDRGCPLATISADITRQSAGARAAFDAGLARIVGRIAAMLSGSGRCREGQEAVELATSLLSEMAGAVALSRAIADREASGRILDAARAALRLRAGLPPEQSSAAESDE